MILINYCIFNKNGWTNILQLTLALRKHAQTARQFVDVFARDELPLIIDEIPAIIIANTDPSTKPGSHWILFNFYFLFFYFFTHNINTTTTTTAIIFLE